MLMEPLKKQLFLYVFEVHVSFSLQIAWSFAINLTLYLSCMHVNLLD